jgi:hypothetical protein
VVGVGTAMLHMLRMRPSHQRRPTDDAARAELVMASGTHLTALKEALA